MFEMYDEDFADDDENEGGEEGDFPEEQKRGNDVKIDTENRVFLNGGELVDDEIEEEPTVVTIKTLTPSSQQLESLSLQPGENTITFTVQSRL